jgi:hypothetical protein
MMMGPDEVTQTRSEFNRGMMRGKFSLGKGLSGIINGLKII